MIAITSYTASYPKTFAVGCAAGVLACIAIHTLLKQRPASAQDNFSPHIIGYRCTKIDRSKTLGEGCSKAEVARELLRRLDPNAVPVEPPEVDRLTSLGIAAECLGKVDLKRSAEEDIRENLESELLSWIGNRFNVSTGTFALGRYQATTIALRAIVHYMAQNSTKKPPFQIVTLLPSADLLYPLAELNLTRVILPKNEAQWDKAINEHTIAIVGYTLDRDGKLDPIAKMASLATRHDIMMHVDAYTGGSVLPYLASEKCPPLTPKGVTSLTVRPYLENTSYSALTAVYFTSDEVAGYAPFLGMQPLCLIAANWVAAREAGGMRPIQSAQMRDAITGEIKRRIESEVPELIVVDDTQYTTLRLKPRDKQALSAQDLIDQMRRLDWDLAFGSGSCLQLEVTAKMANTNDIDDRFVADLQQSIEALKQEGGGSAASDPADAT